MKIAVLVSGGVDSSVALKLLQEQGHDVSAFYLKIWLEDELAYLGDCPWEEDLSYVRRICEEAKIPLHVVPLQKEYFESVVKYTIDEVAAGRTPNPDVMCNSNVKFGFFLDKLREIDPAFEKIATGHYAQTVEKNSIFYLKKAPDKVKDQTYFLANLKQEQIKKLLFPIGHLTKSEVRELAQKYNLPNKDRKDSQGICFLGKFKYNEFVKHYLGEKKGDLIEFETGKKIGEHEGYYFYTVGQRKGIQLSGGPWYVVDKDIDKNIVFISKSYHEPEKNRNHFEVANLNWFEGKIPVKNKLQVKLRHGENFYNCELSQENSHKLKVQLDCNDQGIAAGQFAVFYDDEICLGAGVIVY